MSDSSNLEGQAASKVGAQAVAFVMALDPNTGVTYRVGSRAEAEYAREHGDKLFVVRGAKAA